MWETVQAIAGVGFFVVLGLSAAAKRRPDIAWLQAFRLPEMPRQRREHHRKLSNRLAGIQLILLGLCLPIGYVVLTAMTFSNFDSSWIIGVGLASIGCIALGVTALVQNWR